MGHPTTITFFNEALVDSLRTGPIDGVADAEAALALLGYGTGHGAAGARVGLHRRHAQLAANAAITWCQLMLDTLADPSAPWR